MSHPEATHSAEWWVPRVTTAAMLQNDVTDAIADAAIQLCMAQMGAVFGFATDDDWFRAGIAFEHARRLVHDIHPLTLAARAGAATETDYLENQ